MWSTSSQSWGRLPILVEMTGVVLAVILVPTVDARQSIILSPARVSVRLSRLK